MEVQVRAAHAPSGLLVPGQLPQEHELVVLLAGALLLLLQLTQTRLDQETFNKLIIVALVGLVLLQVVQQRQLGARGACLLLQHTQQVVLRRVGALVSRGLHGGVLGLPEKLLGLLQVGAAALTCKTALVQALGV